MFLYCAEWPFEGSMVYLDKPAGGGAGILANRGLHL